ncbi:NADP-dependent oxidoreductase [Amnibacterium endophyticum]|uniref:NADP-dependent oxidoreductase n=1 Tax=Amnibacterium endophyticum TaxID=2109337 RepID=A0ABW4LFA0_9MICO
MRVVGVTEFGGPERLGVHEVRDPHAGPGEVRIRVAAAAVNPTDAGVRGGMRDAGDAPPPWVAGMDAAGVVDEVGEGAPYEVGDRLMAIALPLSEHGGADVELLVGPWESMARVPAGASLEEASTLPMNGLTAVQLLRLLALPEGAVLAVTGAAGWLGNLLVPLAKRDGLIVVADAKAEDRALVTGLGADLVLERGSGFADRVRAAYPDGVDGLADLSVQQAEVLPAVRDGGRFASVRGWQGEPGRDVEFVAARVFSEYRSHDDLDRLGRLAEQGVLVPRVAEVLPAERAADAHRRMEAGGVRGRLVLAF